MDIWANMKNIIYEIAWASILHLAGVQANPEGDKDSIIASVGVAITGLALAIIYFCCLRRCFSQNKESPPPYRKIHERKLSSKFNTATPTRPEIIALTDSGDKDSSSVTMSDDDHSATRLQRPISYGTTVPLSVKTTITTTSLSGNSPPPPYSELYP